MMDLTWCWLLGLALTHSVAYCLGIGDGRKQAQPLDKREQFQLEIYKIDKHYEHERWKLERSGKHE